MVMNHQTCWGYAIFRQTHLWMDVYFEAFVQSTVLGFWCSASSSLSNLLMNTRCEHVGDVESISMVQKSQSKAKEWCQTHPHWSIWTNQICETGDHCSLRSPYTCGCWKPLPWARRWEELALSLGYTQQLLFGGRNPVPVGRSGRCWLVVWNIFYFPIYWE